MEGVGRREGAVPCLELLIPASCCAPPPPRGGGAAPLRSYPTSFLRNQLTARSGLRGHHASPSPCPWGPLALQMERSRPGGSSKSAPLAWEAAASQPPCSESQSETSPHGAKGPTGKCSMSLASSIFGRLARLLLSVMTWDSTGISTVNLLQACPDRR